MNKYFSSQHSEQTIRPYLKENNRFIVDFKVKSSVMGFTLFSVFIMYYTI